MNVVPLALFGHAFGENFSLPLPVWMFIFGGVSAVLLSFVLVSILYDARATEGAKHLKQINSRAFTVVGAIGKRFGLFVFAVTVAAGFLGSPYATENFNVTLFWVIFFIGSTYATAVLGNIWKVINPFLSVVELIEHISRKQFNGSRPYPKRLGYYPALVIYFVVICIELLFDNVGIVPASLSAFLAYYALITVMGCVVFGKTAWFRYVDFFSVYFKLISKLSPFAYRKRKLVLRAPFSGLLEERPEHTSLVLFVIFMLASTTFDGFTETKQYIQAADSLSSPVVEQLFGVAFLLGITLLLYGLYVAFMALAKTTVRTNLSVRQLCRAFAFTLIPIAVGYNVAHYLSYLVTTGQYSIAQISDPFNMGWNVFGTADYQINPTPLTPYATWYLQVGAIVIGHVVAVYLAHKVALEMHQKRLQVTVGQIPVIALMLVYTTISLWIIAQPIYLAAEQREAIRQQEAKIFRSLREPSIPLPPPR